MTLRKFEKRNDELKDGLAKAPTDTGYAQGNPEPPEVVDGPPRLVDGQLALNTNVGDPCIWMRRSDNRLAKFRPTSDLRIVDRASDLPGVVPTPPPQGETYLIRFENDGVTPLLRLAIWDETKTTIPPGGGAAVVAPGWQLQRDTHVWRHELHTDAAEPGPGNLSVLAVGDLELITESDRERVSVWDGEKWRLLFDAQEERRRLTGFHWKGRTTDLPVPALDNAIPSGEAYLLSMDLAGKPLDRIMVWQEKDPEVAGTGTAQTGSWHPIAPKIWLYALRTDPDPISNQLDGDLRITSEREHQEIKVWSEVSNAWLEVLSADQIKAWIAALNLFEGTVVETGKVVPGAVDFTALPDLGANQGAELSAHYFTFVGSPGYAIKPTDPNGVGVDLPGALLNPGDWLQVVNRGTAATPDMHWVVIGGDLLAKSRADLLYGLQPWTAGSWEQGSLVLKDGDVYRATRGILPADPDPTAAVVPPATQPWELLPLSGGLKVAQVDPQMGPGALPDSGPVGQVWLVLQSAVAGGRQGLFAYDPGAQEWQQLGGGGVPLDLSGGVELINVGLPIGTIIAYFNIKAPPGWLLCNGQVCPAIYKEIQPYLWNGRVPDLRGQFIMGSESDANDQINGFTRHQDTTRLPRNPFKAAEDGDHQHIGGQATIRDWAIYGYSGQGYGYSSASSGDRFFPKTNLAGKHTHDITGGDPITRPPHTILAYIIKVADRAVRPRTL